MVGVLVVFGALTLGDEDCSWFRSRLACRLARGLIEDSRDEGLSFLAFFAQRVCARAAGVYGTGSEGSDSLSESSGVVCRLFLGVACVCGCALLSSSEKTILRTRLGVVGDAGWEEIDDMLLTVRWGVVVASEIDMIVGL